MSIPSHASARLSDSPHIAVKNVRMFVPDCAPLDLGVAYPYTSVCPTPIKQSASRTFCMPEGRHPMSKVSDTSRPVPHLRILGILLACAAGVAHAQSAPCGLTSMQDSVKLVYPPIAKAAHVQGSVILMTTFRQDGTVADISPVSGPEMLRTAAITYVKGLRANEFSGPRQCPVVITFRIVGESVECGTPSRINDQLGIVPEFVRTDPQHVVTTYKASCSISQAAVSVARR
jgi:hypothetical protein